MVCIYNALILLHFFIVCQYQRALVTFFLCKRAWIVLLFRYKLYIYTVCWNAVKIHILNIYGGLIMQLRSPFMQQLQQNMRMRGYSLRTEKTYLYWIRDYIRFHNRQHPMNLASDHVVQLWMAWWWLLFVHSFSNPVPNVSIPGFNPMNLKHFYF